MRKGEKRGANEFPGERGETLRQEGAQFHEHQEGRSEGYGRGKEMEGSPSMFWQVAKDDTQRSVLEGGDVSTV